MITSHSIKYSIGGLVVVLVGVSAFLDDLLEQRPLRAPDFALGALLAAVTALALIALDRIAAARARQAGLARRRRGDVRALHALGHGGGLSEILDRVLACACEVLHVERAVVTVADRGDSEGAVVVAARGPGSPEVGERIAAGEDTRAGSPPDHVVAPSGAGPALRAIAAGAIPGASGVAAAPVTWGESVRGMLAVGVDDPDRRLTSQELEVVVELSELSAVALEQVELRERAQQKLGAYVDAFGLALDARDHYTASHSHRVEELACEVGSRLEMTEDEIAELEIAARMHDLGKLGVPDAILTKPGALDAAEWAVMREHPVWGAELLGRIPALEGVATIVRAAHEHWDGGGYPDGLEGEQIPLAARIVLACDALHAMTSHRPYRAAIPIEQALGELTEHAGGQFDPRVTRALSSILAEELSADSDAIGLDDVRAATRGDRLAWLAVPVVDLATTRTALHALCFQMTGVRGRVYEQGDLQLAAQRFGLASDLDGATLAYAVRLAAEGCAVTVRISGAGLGDPDLGARLERELSGVGAAPGRLVLRLGESDVVANRGMALRVCERIRSLGCLVAIDEVGSSRAGWGYLSSLEVDAVWIDSRLVAGLPDDPGDVGAVQALVELAADLGVETVATGVEDDGTARRARALGLGSGVGPGLGVPASPLEGLGSGASAVWRES